MYSDIFRFIKVKIKQKKSSKGVRRRPMVTRDFTCSLHSYAGDTSHVKSLVKHKIFSMSFNL